MHIKPKGKVVYGGRKPNVNIGYLEMLETEVAAWCPDDSASVPPIQVHLIFKIRGLENHFFVIRFKGPDTLGFLIEELERYRRYVWPNAEPVQLEET